MGGRKEISATDWSKYQEAADEEVSKLAPIGWREEEEIIFKAAIRTFAQEVRLRAAKLEDEQGYLESWSGFMAEAFTELLREKGIE